MTGEDEDPVIAVAMELTGSFQAMTGQLERLNGRQDRADRRDRRLRRVIAGLAVSLCLDLAITAGLGWNTIRQNDIQARQVAIQDGIRASDIRQCQLSNISRGQDIAIWNRLLTIPASATAAQKAEVAALERLVHVKDKPRDCAAAFRK